MNSFSESYKAAGVDVTAGYKAVELMKKHVARTNIPGVFAAGDVRHKEVRQLTTAAADGTTAAILAEKYLAQIRKGK